MEEIPDWFWEVIEATKPRVSELEAWLESQPKRTVEHFAFAYMIAATSLADYSEGVRVDGFVWSEDSTEDLCDWVVSQGRVFWTAVVSGDWALADVAEVYLGRPSPLSDESTQWSHEVSNPDHRGCRTPSSIAGGVYWTRFGEDLHERIDSPDYAP